MALNVVVTFGFVKVLRTWDEACGGRRASQSQQNIQASSKPINVNVTIHKFFNKVSGPTSAPAEEGQENLFPLDERQNIGYGL